MSLLVSVATLPDDIQRRDPIGLGHGGEIEDIVDVGVDVEFGGEAELPDVHQLRGAIAGDLHAHHAPAARIGDELEQAALAAVDLATRDFLEARAAHQRAAEMPARAVLVEADGGDLRDGVHARGLA